jgi:hypothetical protein
VRSPPVFFVAVAFALVGLLLAGQPFGAAEPAPYWTLHGHTSQNDAIQLRLDARHRVRTFEVTTQLRCSNGGSTSTSWEPSEGGAPARFGSRGPRFDAEEFRRFHHSDGSVSTSEGTIRGVIAGHEAHGTVTAYTSYRRPDGSADVCSAGHVSWTAR